MRAVGCLRRCRPWVALVLLAPLAGGCGRSVTQDELDRASKAVQAGLEVWRRGEPMARLLALDPPIQLSDDDWSKGLRLVEYSIIKTEGEPGAPVRCTVTMTLRDRRGRTVPRDSVYEVKSGPTIIVARDPYF